MGLDGVLVFNLPQHFFFEIRGLIEGQMVGWLVLISDFTSIKLQRILIEV